MELGLYTFGDLAIPILGGTLPGYAQLINVYRQVWEQSDNSLEECRISVFSHLP